MYRLVVPLVKLTELRLSAVYLQYKIYYATYYLVAFSLFSQLWPRWHLHYLVAAPSVSKLFLVLVPNNSAIDLPLRPYFSRDARNYPWTDGKGDQEAYVKNVSKWCRYNDALPPNNQIVFFMRLVVSPPCSTIRTDRISLQRDFWWRHQNCSWSRSYMQTISKAKFSVVSVLFEYSNKLLNTTNHANETFYNLESR